MSESPVPYRVGIARCDITPPVGIKLAGFAARNEPSSGVYRPLGAVAVAIDDGRTPILLLAAEWLGFYDKTPFMRTRLARVTGINEKHIVLSGTHTHCGPVVREMDVERHGLLDSNYLTRAFDEMTACAARAWRLRETAVLRFGSGQCAVARCRRKPDPAHPHKVQRSMLPNDQGHVDHDVPLITIESPRGALRGVLFSYACHPTARGGLEIGGDYVGFAIDRIETSHRGAVACFLQGCGGDQKPRPVDPGSGVFGIREVEQVRQIGFELGDAVNDVIRAGQMQPLTGDITVTQQMLDLHTEPLDEGRASLLLEAEEGYKRKWARHQLTSVANGQPVSTIVPFELQTIRFGKSLAIVTMAGEMTAEYSLRLKRDLRRHFTHVLPLAYTNDIVGYVPVQRQISEEGYEVIDSNMYYQRTGPYVRATEERIILAAEQELGVVD